MKQSTASNVALVLGALAWPLCIYGFFSRLGDFVPDTPRYVIERHERIALVVVSAGLLALCGSLWLSGFSFSGARVRSMIAILGCFGLVFLAIFSLSP